MSLKIKYWLGWLAIAVVLILVYWGWQRWSLTIPRSLPQQPGIESSLNGGSYYEVSTSPIKNDRILAADYRIWIPNGQPVRGLLVKQHGCSDSNDSKGLNHANDLQWQALALKHQFALVGTRLPTEYPMCSNKAIVDRAAEKTFLKAMALLAQKSGRTELHTVPWIIWGHSGGADWGTQMLEDIPHRTIAVINVHSGGIRSTYGNSEILNLDLDSAIASNLIETPMLWFVGAKDPVKEEAVELPKKIFYKFKPTNPLWTLAIGPYTDHGAGNTRFLAIPYVDAIATARLAQNNEILPVDVTEGWLGEITTKEVFPISEYQGDFTQTVWLPNRETALKWQQYVTSSKILPLSKPNAPVNVTVSDISSTNKTIKWDYTPDLENGLPNFRIYRNNLLIQTLKGQAYGYGDVTLSPYPVLEFEDLEASSNAVYTVAAFNQLGENKSLPTKSSHHLQMDNGQ